MVGRLILSHLVGPPVLKTNPVASGNAEAIVKILQDNFKQSPTVRITAVNDNSIMAWARSRRPVLHRPVDP